PHALAALLGLHLRALVGAGAGLDDAVLRLLHLDQRFLLRRFRLLGGHDVGRTLLGGRDGRRLARRGPLGSGAEEGGGPLGRLFEGLGGPGGRGLPRRRRRERLAGLEHRGAARHFVVDRVGVRHGRRGG